MSEKKCLCCGVDKEIKNEVCVSCLEWLYEMEIREEVLRKEFEERNTVQFTYFD